MDQWYVYIVDKKGKLYVRITTDLPNRMRQHGVAEALYQEGPMNKSDLEAKKDVKRTQGSPTPGVRTCIISIRPRPLARGWPKGTRSAVMTNSVRRPGPPSIHA